MIRLFRGIPAALAVALAAALVFGPASAQEIQTSAPTASTTPLGTQPIANSAAVNPATGAQWTIAEPDGNNVTLGSKADAAYSGSGSASLIAIAKAIAAGLASTPAGTSAANGQGVQGVTGGVPVGVAGFYSASLPTQSAGAAAIQLDVRGQAKVSETGSSDPLVGVTPSNASSGTSLVAKAAPGNLYGAYATNLTGTGGYLVMINATAAPSAGATITPVDCLPIAANLSAGVNFGAGPPDAYSTGIVLLLSTSCTTYTAGPSGFLKARAR